LLWLAKAAVLPSSSTRLHLPRRLLLRHVLKRERFQEGIVIKQGLQPAAKLHFQRGHVNGR